MTHFSMDFFRLRKNRLLLPLFFVLLNLITSCSTLQFTPVTPENTGFSRQGLVVWYDLLTEDVVTAQTFYAELFGWKYEKHGGYVVVLNGGIPIGGMVEKTSIARIIHLIFMQVIHFFFIFEAKQKATRHKYQGTTATLQITPVFVLIIVRSLFTPAQWTTVIVNDTHRLPNEYQACDPGH